MNENDKTVFLLYNGSIKSWYMKSLYNVLTSHLYLYAWILEVVGSCCSEFRI